MAKIYKVLIEETSLSSIYVEADSHDEACIIASDRYVDGERNWIRGNIDIVDIKEINENNT